MYRKEAVVNERRQDAFWIYYKRPRAHLRPRNRGTVSTHKKPGRNRSETIPCGDRSCLPCQLLLPYFPELTEDVREADLPQLCVLLEALHEPVFELVRHAAPDGHSRLDLRGLRKRCPAVRRGRIADALVTCCELRQREVDRCDRRRLCRGVDERDFSYECVFRAPEEL